MAKKKTTRRKTRQPAKEASVESDPNVQAAADKVKLAREELRKAEQMYSEMRVQASEQIERLKDTTVGELIDDTMEVVKKHPGLSVVAATIIGFFLGRLFRP